MTTLSLDVIVSGPKVPRWIYDTIANVAAMPNVTVRIVQLNGHRARGIFSTEGPLGTAAGKLPKPMRKALGKYGDNAFVPTDIRDLRIRIVTEDQIAEETPGLALSLAGTLPAPLLATLQEHRAGIASVRVRELYPATANDISSRIAYEATGNGLALFEFQRGDYRFAQDISTTIARSDAWIKNNLCLTLPCMIAELLNKALTIEKRDLTVSELAPATGSRTKRRRSRLAASLVRQFKFAFDRIKPPPKWELMYADRHFNLHDLSAYRRIAPPPDTEWADPFAVEHEGSTYVFFEDYPYKAAAKAHLSAVEIRPDGTRKLYEKIVDEPFHLSYPQVFRFDGTYYMMPESSQDRSLRIYRCLRFPDRWVLEKRLLEGKDFADSTLFAHGGKYWLFTSHSTGREGHNSNLYLYSSTDPFSGDWVPHPHNPIHTDIRRSRMAGPVYKKDGKIYRLSQYSEHHYGEAVNLNEIVELNEHSYREIPAARLEPSRARGVAGIHTITETSSLRFVDALRIK